MTLAAIAVVAGLLIGLSLGALGGGGSILAVPVLVYALDQTPLQATTGSLVVVGVSSVIGAVTAHRAGNLLLGRGISFGLVAVAGAVVGAKASAHVDEAVLLAAFALLMLLVAVLMVQRLVRGRNEQSAEPPTLDDPIITFSPTFICRCPRALKVLVTATAVGLLTGFLGVGGGFLVVPALVLALGLSMRHAPGTSLIVMAITITAALGVVPAPDSSPIGDSCSCSPPLPRSAFSSAHDWPPASTPAASPRPSPASSLPSRWPPRHRHSPHSSDHSLNPARRRSIMCRAVSCRQCRKTTWAGCGMHVNQVMAGVPSAQRCPGHPKAERSGLWSRLFGARPNA